jgi:hypothetical protein
MKLFIKIFIVTLCLITGASCTLDMQDDPNAVQPENTVPNLVLNSMQRNLAVLFNGASTNGMLLTRLQNPGASTYGNVFNPQSFDATWNTGYGSILQDANTLLKQTDELGYSRHSGIARIISAYTLLLMVDYFGDVPYSKAFQGLDELNPGVDDDKDLYTVILGLLDQAAIDLTTPNTDNGGTLSTLAIAPTDMYYYTHTQTVPVAQMVYTSWLKVANTIKLKIYLNLRLTDPAGAMAGIDALATATGGLITTAADNFVFRYGTSTADPDSRHPRFVATYPAGGGNYMSNWLMWHMFHGYTSWTAGGTPGDPRMRFYLYRQVNTNSSDPNQIRCVSGSNAPQHYPQGNGSSIFYGAAVAAPPLGFNAYGVDGSSDASNHAWSTGSAPLPRTFCYPTNVGYWGRDMLNSEGTPPDAFQRTLWGVYPAGGRFDANNAAGVSASQGMKGAGLQPILMRSFVQFMLAEAALTLPGVNTGNIAREHFRLGMQNSFDDVRAFAVNGTFGVGPAASTEATTINSFYPNAGALPGVFSTAVRAATSINITLSGLQTIDGIALAAGERVLVKNQTLAAQNGIYDVSAGAWTRSSTSDASAELVGAVLGSTDAAAADNQAVTVQEGTLHRGTNWRIANTAAITVGTTAVNWTTTTTYTSDVNVYTTRALATYDAQVSSLPAEDAVNKTMNYVAREYWVSSFGNGIEAYNLYRRTGMPTGMQPALNSTPGVFPRILFYPAVFANLNSTITQRTQTDLGSPVFWDNNTANLNF